MSHALFVNIPAHGHVNPTLPLAAELAARGERVDYALTAEFGPAIEQAGARLLPFETLAFTAPPPAGGASPPPDFSELPTRLVRAAIHVLPQLEEGMAADPPDYVVYDPFALFGRLLAKRLGVPAIQTNPSYAFAEEAFRAPAFRQLTQAAGRDPPAEFAEAGRELAARFGGEPPTMRDLFMSPAGLNLVFIPRAFQPAADALDESWVFVGPSVGPRDSFGEGPPIEGLDGGPVLFVSLGTVFNNQAPFFQACLDAFGGTDWRLVLAVSRAVDLDAVGPVPPNAVVRRQVPQLDVLARASVFVTHGGMNSTMESILAEVPMVVVPQMLEQAVTADQVAELGLGRRLDPADVSVATLSEAVSGVLADEAIPGRLAAMREAAEEAGGPRRAADEVLRYVR